MEEKVKYIHSQDAYFKVAPKKSGETSLNLSNDILNFIADGTMNSNSERLVTFRLFKEDLLKALASIVNSLPLYVSSSKDCRKEVFSVSFFDDLLYSINTFFGIDAEKDYEVNLLYRKDGRIYLNGLKVDGFSIRNFLIEDKSVLHFIKDKGILFLRLESNSDKRDYDSQDYIVFEETNLPRQIIYYGAPGTGKSNRIDELTDNGNRIRTTFHPDSDYSTFVGAYKPTMKRLPRYNPNSGMQMGEEEKIAYQFVPQAFLKAYVEAWKCRSEGNEEPFYLVIEEINRGNCAQIFGDLFQLLDRNETGQSKYAICPDDDIRRYLQEAFEKCETLDEEIRSGAKMLLPANLYIWATMNTSDQSLFPIDSAFKRRWDWEYMPIEDAGKGHVIVIGTKRYDWWTFISRINDKIGRITNSEDKKLGYWFVIPANGGTEITAKQFVSKVLFYLWNDVYKDYAESSESIFKTANEDGTVVDAPFTSFFGKDAELRLQGFMRYNEIEPKAENEEIEDLEGKDDEESSTEIQEWRQDFWTDLKEQYAQKGLDFRTTPQKRYCYQMSLGVIGLSLMNWVNKSQNKCSVGIYIEAKQGDEYYGKLSTIKETIDDEVGETLLWTHEQGRYASAKLIRNYDLDNSTKRMEALRWIAEKGKVIHDVFKSHLDVLS